MDDRTGTTWRRALKAAIGAASIGGATLAIGAAALAGSPAAQADDDFGLGDLIASAFGGFAGADTQDAGDWAGNWGWNPIGTVGIVGGRS